MNVASFQQFAVDREIRQIVRTARQEGHVLRLSAVTKELRATHPGVAVHRSYVLDRLIRTAARTSVAIEIDVPPTDLLA